MVNLTLLLSQNPQKKKNKIKQKMRRMSINTQSALHLNSYLELTRVNNSKEENMKTSSNQVFQTLTYQDQRAILHSIWNALISQKTLSLLRIRGRQGLVKLNPLS